MSAGREPCWPADFVILSEIRTDVLKIGANPVFWDGRDGAVAVRQGPKLFTQIDCWQALG